MWGLESLGFRTQGLRVPCCSEERCFPLQGILKSGIRCARASEPTVRLLAMDDMGVSEIKGHLIFGVLTRRILLYLGYYIRIPYFRKPPHDPPFGKCVLQIPSPNAGSGTCAYRCGVRRSGEKKNAFAASRVQPVTSGS